MQEKKPSLLEQMKLDPKTLRTMSEELENRRKKTAEIIQSTYGTQVGRDFIRWLVVETRLFAMGLPVVSNLKTKYSVSSDYYLGQMDLIKKIFEFLTSEQVADLTAAIVKQNVEKKEQKNVGTD